MRASFLLLCAALFCPALVSAQTARVSAPAENFRAAPGGSLLATVARGASLRLGASDGQWREVTLEGWIWAASVRARRGGRLDLVVSAAGGENLRAQPNGTLLAELRPGMLLQRIERRGAWVRVRRTGWIWGPSLDASAGAGPTPTPAGEAGARLDTAANPTPAPVNAPDTQPAAEPDPAPPGSVTRLGAAGGAVLDRRAGDTIAALRPRAAIEVRARDGDWVRVRIEGWVRASALASAADTGAVLTDLAPASLRGNPDAFAGRLIEWSIQFISLERAERIRTDFREGEPFMLARAPGPDAGFAYVAVPEDLVNTVRRLAPLREIRILARVRVGRSEMLGAPVLELVELR